MPPSESTDPRVIAIPASLLREFHDVAASGHDVARALEAHTREVVALRDALALHVSEERPLILAHDRREAAREKARVDAEARLIADGELADARRRAEEAEAAAETATAKKIAATRIWQIIAAGATLIALVLGALVAAHGGTPFLLEVPHVAP